MTRLLIIIKRNFKLFFKDKGLLLTSLITPLILLILYATFLRNVYKSSFVEAFGENGIEVPSKLINGIVSGQLVSSLLAVSCVTVSFCSNMLMVQDKLSGARKDFLITPVKKSSLALSYYISTFCVTFIICLIAMFAGFIYLAATGWYLTFGSVLLTILDVFMLTMFGTALSSIVNYFLSSQGQLSAVGTIVSAGYGFICGAYMPISAFSKSLQKIVGLLPGTYGTSLMRRHLMGDAVDKLKDLGTPAEPLNGIKDALDINLYFFDHQVPLYVMYLVLGLTIVALIGAYVLINLFQKKRKN